MESGEAIMRRTSFIGLAVAVWTLTLAPVPDAKAQVTAEQQSAIRANCRSDFMSKCSGVTPGGKDALMCLQKNVASLAPACKTAVSATIPAAAPAAEAKPAQAAPAAAAAPPPPPPPAAPAAASAPPPAAPKPSQATITTAPPPRAALPARSAAPKPQQVQPPQVPKPAVVTSAAAATPAPDAAPAPTAAQLKAVSFSCRRDLSANCRGVPNGAESIACLRRNSGRLAPECKTSLAAIADTAPLAPAAPGTPAATRAPNAPVVMTAVTGRACLRDLALHCRGTGIGDGQKIACLTARGERLAPLCKAALKVTGPVR
jgi:hypothetical protein